MYRADGLKVKKTYGPKVTDYLDGFQYENAVLQFMPTAEGYYDFKNGKYIYNYKDHLGNVRITFTKNASNVAVVLEENNYYPFGLKHQGYNTGNTSNNTYAYKYNGKELQENGLLDYGWRNYMPELGRWNVIDQLAEKYHDTSPYTYVINNPIALIDPDGRDVQPIDGGWTFTGTDIGLVLSYFRSGGNFANFTDQLQAYQDGGGFSSGRGGSGGMSNGISNFWNTFNSGGIMGGVSVANGYLSWWTNRSIGPSGTGAKPIQEMIVHRTKLDQGNFNAFMWPQLNNLEYKNDFNSKFNDPLFYISTGLSSYGIYDGYKTQSFIRNEIWWQTKTRGISNIFQKRWATPIAKAWRAEQAIKGSKFAKTMSYAAIATTTLTVINNQNIKTSDIINASMGTLAVAIPGIGTTVSGIYFTADLVTMGVSYLATGQATSIGDYIDQGVENVSGNRGGYLYQWGPGHLLY